jgi:hypothetical protein
MQLGKISSVISAAYAIAELVKNLYTGLPKGIYVSIGVTYFIKLM